MLDAAVEEAVNAVADEAANLIGEFDEGFSNRQTWHNAALAAIAVWFEDEELAGRAIEGPTGAIAHLVRGFGDDGMWYEGENYHLFALRGQLLAMGWARQAGVDILADPRLAGRLEGALRAPALTALPDFTFPARKDSRFGISLAQPMYLELWEVGLARLGDPAADLWDWLRALYAVTGAEGRALRFIPARHRSRCAGVAPDPGGPLLVGAAGDGSGAGRRAGRMASGKYAAGRAGPRHPPERRAGTPASSAGATAADTATPTGFISRSTPTGNTGCPIRAPGPTSPAISSGIARPWRTTRPGSTAQSQPPGDAECLAFGESGDWAWARGGYKEYLRTVVAGPRYLIDVLELSSPEEHLLELPWHPNGEVEVVTPGRWEAEPGLGEFVPAAERFIPDQGDRPDPAAMHRSGIQDLLAAPGSRRGAAAGRGAGAARLDGTCALLRAASARVRRAPGVGARVRLGRAVRAVVERERRPHRGGDGGRRRPPREHQRRLAGDRGGCAGLPSRDPPRRRRRTAPPADRYRTADADHRTRHRPPRSSAVLDGTLDAFDFSEPLELDHEDQYRRSEEPYAGPEDFSAAAAVNWDDDALYVAVEVRKPAMLVRDDAAPPLGLDNEPDDIHADGIQIYLRPAPERPAYGFLIVPSDRRGRNPRARRGGDRRHRRDGAAAPGSRPRPDTRSPSRSRCRTGTRVPASRSASISW